MAPEHMRKVNEETEQQAVERKHGIFILLISKLYVPVFLRMFVIIASK